MGDAGGRLGRDAGGVSGTVGEDVVRIASDELGFALAGVAPAQASEWADAFRSWLDAGRHGEMAYLAEHAGVRTDPSAFVEGCRSLLMVADQYAARGAWTDERPSHGFGRVARYARGGDYHTVIRKRLHALADRLRARWPDETFRAFVDTAPVFEREHAMRAGLGWIGKHTLLIHPERGSWLLLGGIATTLEIETPAGRTRIADHCGTCTRCIDACPTDAIAPYSVDATRCISYLTIEHRGPIDERFHRAMGDWIFGCDICQEVCPHNSPRGEDAAVGKAHPAYEQRRSGFDLLAVLGWGEDDRREAFAGSALKRAKLAMMKRNAAIAAKNSLRAHEDPRLRAGLDESGLTDPGGDREDATAGGGAR